MKRNRVDILILSAILIGFAVLIPFLGNLFAAGSCVFTLTDNRSILAVAGNPTVELSWVCTSAANGTISSPTIVGDRATAPYSGHIKRITIIPGVVRVPSDQFDLYVYGNPATTVDALGGLGVNSSNVTTKTDLPLTSVSGWPLYLFNQQLTPSAANMGNATTVTVGIVVGQ